MAIEPDSITPDLDVVASYIRLRTMDADGYAQGEFNEHTRPNAEEAELIAQRAARHVALELGTVYTKWDGDLSDVATDVVALYAALQIETSFNGDGAGQDSAIMDQLGRMYREQLKALKQTARDAQIGSDPIKSVQIVRARRRSPVAP